METPRVLRAQLKEYEKAGFHAIRIEPRAGSHFKVWYAELPDKPQIITKNAKSFRVMKNTISNYRKLLPKAEQ